MAIWSCLRACWDRFVFVNGDNYLEVVSHKIVQLPVACNSTLSSSLKYGSFPVTFRQLNAFGYQMDANQLEIEASMAS